MCLRVKSAPERKEGREVKKQGRSKKGKEGRTSKEGPTRKEGQNGRKEGRLFGSDVIGSDKRI